MSLVSASSGSTNAAFTVALLSPGVLNHLSVYTDDPQKANFLTSIDVGLATTPFTLGTRFHSIVSGYLYWFDPLRWSGLIDIQDSTFLYLMVAGDRNNIVRVESHRLVEFAKPELGSVFSAASD